MLLAIDVGNTNVVFALIEGQDVRYRWRIATDPRRTADQYAVWVFQLFALEGLDKSVVEAVVVGTVVPRALHNLEVLAQKYFGLPLLVAGQAPLEWGIRFDVDQPRTVGADRAINTIAAHNLYDGDLVVIDFGTATTFDVVGADGAYRGGIIAPGINLSLDALVGATAKLPRIAIEVPQDSRVIGRNTEDQMLIGVFWGYIAMMEGLVTRMKAEIGRPMKVIATGGLAVVFDGHTNLFDAVEGDLTLRGMAIMYQAHRAHAL